MSKQLEECEIGECIRVYWKNSACILLKRENHSNLKEVTNISLLSKDGQIEETFVGTGLFVEIA